MLNVPDGWQHILKDEIEKPYFQELAMFLQIEYKTKQIFPSEQHLFNALSLTPYDEVKVVILGQDPYHGDNQAHGLSFSVQQGIKIPPSLRNMYKELEDDLQVAAPLHGDLTGWAKQGVLLLNTVLTVEKGKANSHQNKGWEQFTDAMIKALVKRPQPIIFVLWGAPAQKKEPFIQQEKHHIIMKAPHPSPLSAYRGFFGSKPYSSINQLLDTPIDWTIS